MSVLGIQTENATVRDEQMSSYSGAWMSSDQYISQWLIPIWCQRPPSQVYRISRFQNRSRKNMSCGHTKRPRGHTAKLLCMAKRKPTWAKSSSVWNILSGRLYHDGKEEKPFVTQQSCVSLYWGNSTGPQLAMIYTTSRELEPPSNTISAAVGRDARCWDWTSSC